jgi:hypothetical protein
MRVTVKVDRTGILAMARELQRYSPMPLEHIFRSEVGSIVKICLLRSKVASEAKVRRRVEAAALTKFKGDGGHIISINQQRDRGRIWFAPADYRDDPARGYRRTTAAASVWFMVYSAGGGRGWHIPDHLWLVFLGVSSDGASYAKAVIAIMLKRRGLLRQSWLQILDALRVPAVAIAPAGNVQEATVRAARGYRGRTYPNGVSLLSGANTKLRLEVGNASPLALKRDGQAELDRATTRRQRGFIIALQKGQLTDLKARASRWPGIFVAAA